MKPDRTCRFVTVGAVAALLLVASFAVAGEASTSDNRTRAKHQSPTKQPAATAPAKQSKLLLTGSHIPSKARQMGMTADTPYPIYIIGGKEIARSGAGSISEALRRCPAVR